MEHFVLLQGDLVALLKGGRTTEDLEISKRSSSQRVSGALQYEGHYHARRRMAVRGESLNELAPEEPFIRVRDLSLMARSSGQLGVP